VILPKKYLDQCGIEDKVGIAIKHNTITIVAAKNDTTRKWADFRQTNKNGKSSLSPISLMKKTGHGKTIYSFTVRNDVVLGTAIIAPLTTTLRGPD
jgi:hypothetical protein